MSKELELQHEFDVEMSNLFLIFESSNKAFILFKEFKEVSDKDELAYIKENNHIEFISHSLWKQCVILIYLLLKEGEKFSLNKTLNKILPGGEFAKLKIDVKEINKIKSLLHNLEPTIKIIINLREKLYAHFDRTVPESIFSNELTLNEMENLLFFVHYFIKKLSSLSSENIGFVHKSYEVRGKGKKMISDLSNYNKKNN